MIKSASVLGAIFLGVVLISSLGSNSPCLATRPVISAADPLTDPHHLSASISITFTPVFTSYLPIVLHTIPRPPCETYRVDDFSNPDSGWPVGYQSDNVYTEYLAGEYHVVYTMSDGGLRYFNDWQATDYWLEVDVRQAHDNDSYHGLIFGQDTDAAAFDFYYFAINSYTNRYHLTRWAANPDDVKTLVGGNSDAIKSGTALNHLEVERVGSQIKLWINGIQVAQVDDSMFVGNRLVGLSTSVWTDEVYFDNFALCTYAQ